jgi:pyridinium-3,5-biscarboxylic acid mononucleotide sulfurtransferase
MVLARIEVGEHERKLFSSVDVMDLVVLRLKRLGFKYVTFDLEGYRSGSMLETLNH